MILNRPGIQPPNQTRQCVGSTKTLFRVSELTHPVGVRRQLVPAWKMSTDKVVEGFTVGEPFGASSFRTDSDAGKANRGDC